MINPQYFWTIILFLSLATFTIRFSIISISGKIKITDRMKEIFSFIPAAILPALITPIVFLHQGQASTLLYKERFFILVLSALVCYLSKSMFVTILFGLSLLYFCTQFL